MAMAFPYGIRQFVPSAHVPGAVALAVLGDSDSHSYHDRVLITEQFRRGGELRATTWQWTEALGQLRGRFIDQGPWNTWGTYNKVADVMTALRLPGRAPRKEDFRYNFAISGAECHEL